MEYVNKKLNSSLISYVMNFNIIIIHYIYFFIQERLVRKNKSNADILPQSLENFFIILVNSLSLFVITLSSIKNILSFLNEHFNFLVVNIY